MYARLFASAADQHGVAGSLRGSKYKFPFPPCPKPALEPTVHSQAAENFRASKHEREFGVFATSALRTEMRPNVALTRNPTITHCFVARMLTGRCKSEPPAIIIVVQFWLDGGRWGPVAMALSPGTRTVAWGDRSANHLQKISPTTLRTKFW
jgi:hypothetical protein